KVEVLPHAEIIFRNFPDDKPKIVNYAAKWDQESPEFTGTPCTFDFPESDRRLLKKLNEISMECWKIFSLSGYARVDFRVDESEIPWVLEVNANPCLSPDAGFFAACLRADMDAMTMADRIVADALDRYKGEIWAK
ncbi:MAG: D-alanine--D-alanine ligase, partial [Spirochaetaceae bacterium]